MTDSIRAQLLTIYADEHRDHITALRAALEKGAAADFEEAYRHAHSLKGAARAVDMDVVTDIAHALEGLVENWWEGRDRGNPAQRSLAARALDAIEDLSAAALRGTPLPHSHAILEELEQVAGNRAALEGPTRPPAGGVAPTLPVTAQPQTLRVEVDTLNRLAAAMAALTVEVDRLGEAERPLRQLQQDVERIMAEDDATSAHAGLPRIRSLLDEALNDLAERDWTLASAIAALKEDLLRLRMVAAEGILGGFGPMVREMAGEQGKKVRLETEGMTHLADRDVLHALAEAVMHLLRNAVHHGIETPQERVAAGKDPEGRLSLSVAVEGARLVVRVGDDGRGIDTQAVERVAAARGLVAESDSESLKRLIFLPGFSTARAVTTGAGRGMGMGIVQNVSARLQGSLEMDSVPGRGTWIVLTVPVATLVQPLLLIEVRGEVFALPIAVLRGVYTLTTQDLIAVEGGTVAFIDGVQTPLADLGMLLALPGPARTAHSACVAVADHGPVRLGLVADRLLDVREFSVTALDPPLDADERLAGTVVLEDGTLALVLVPAALLALVPPALPAHLWRRPSSPRGPVMVVDDSPTTRALERKILETHGYHVVLAEDGRDALAKMTAEPPWLVISDIEMPNLDGFGLLEAMRREPRLSRLPVILVTSRDTPADRAHGARLGVAAYLSKAEFGEDLLLKAIKGLE